MIVKNAQSSDAIELSDKGMTGNDTELSMMYSIISIYIDI